MEEPITERLDRIESGISRIAETQVCLFDLIQLTSRVSSLRARIDSIPASARRNLNSGVQELDRSIALLAGSLTAVGVAAGLVSLARDTQRPVLMIAGALAIALGLILAGVALWRNLRARSDLRDTRQANIDAEGHIATALEEADALEDDLTRILARLASLR